MHQKDEKKPDAVIPTMSKACWTVTAMGTPTVAMTRFFGSILNNARIIYNFQPRSSR
jgi:hypothetical protein